MEEYGLQAQALLEITLAASGSGATGSEAATRSSRITENLRSLRNPAGLPL
jgi:hypothetical protein